MVVVQGGVTSAALRIIKWAISAATRLWRPHVMGTAHRIQTASERIVATRNRHERSIQDVPFTFFALR